MSPALGSCRYFALLMGLLLTGSALAQEAWLQKLDDTFSYQSPSGLVRADLSGLVDLEAYFVDQRPPGLIFGNSDFLNPRLALFLDAHVGPHLYTFVQFRADRGFDPRLRPDGDARFDEYLLRWTPWEDERLSVQAGKFATVFGKWVQRHDTWQNPFITAPLAYENVTTITDQAAPGTPAAFLGRRTVPDQKATWVPVVWGPAYNSGFSLFGQRGGFDYAVEVKNTAISSRPTAWDAQQVGWENPTVTCRLGHTPSAAWGYGLSASHGAYLLGWTASSKRPSELTFLGRIMPGRFGVRPWSLASKCHAWGTRTPSPTSSRRNTRPPPTSSSPCAGTNSFSTRCRTARAGHSTGTEIFSGWTRRWAIVSPGIYRVSCNTAICTKTDRFSKGSSFWPRN